MNYTEKELGILGAMMKRFEEHRLPRIMDLKEIVDRGEKLSDLDLSFLEDVLRDTEEYHHMVNKHPEFEDLYSRTVHLYHEVVDRALLNEQVQA